MSERLRHDRKDERIVHDLGEDPKCANCVNLAQKVVLYPVYIQLCIHCFMAWLKQMPEGTEIQSKAVIRKHPLFEWKGYQQ